MEVGAWLGERTALVHDGDYTWEKGWCINLVPRAERRSLNDLMPALLIQLDHEHGGIEFIRWLYREIPRLVKLKDGDDYRAVPDDSYLVASIAATQDLHIHLAILRWKIGDSARRGAPNALAQLRNLAAVKSHHSFSNCAA